jgi:hypothetical protein
VEAELARLKAGKTPDAIEAGQDGDILAEPEASTEATGEQK